MSHHTQTMALAQLVQANGALRLDDPLACHMSVGAFAISHVLQHTTKNRKILEYKPPKNLLVPSPFNQSSSPVVLTTPKPE